MVVGCQSGLSHPPPPRPPPAAMTTANTLDVFHAVEPGLDSSQTLAGCAISIITLIFFFEGKESPHWQTCADLQCYHHSLAMILTA